MRRLLVSLAVGVGGMAVLLAGLLWDAVLHAADPGLAGRERLFTLSNPGHALLGVGIGLSLVGLLGAGDAALSLRAGSMDGAARGWGRRGLRPAVGLAAAVLVVAAAGTAAWAARQGHEHVDGGGDDHHVMAPAAGHVEGDGHGHAAAAVPAAAAPAAAVPAAAAPAAAAPAAVAPASDGHAHTHAAAGGPTREQQAAADRLRAATIAATRRWASRDAAEADGFTPMTPVLNGLQHWHNQRFFTDGRVLEPSAPEELIYASTSRGPVLVAAMYLMERVGDRGPAIGGPLTVWHDHDDLCFSAQGRVVGFHRPPRQTCPPGSVNQRTPEMLHVWLVENPAGDFAAEMEPAALLAIAERGDSA